MTQSAFSRPIHPRPVCAWDVSAARRGSLHSWCVARPAAADFALTNRIFPGRGVTIDGTSHITGVVQSVEAGGPKAAGQLLPLVYGTISGNRGLPMIFLGHFTP